MEDLEEFEQDYNRLVEAGKRNARTVELINKWCLHGEVDRMPGRGIIEDQTGLPIGHMAMTCKYSKKSTSYCYFLEDAVYEFYLENCKSCTERVPVGIPNITEIVAPREKAAAERNEAIERERKENDLKRAQRAKERADLRSGLTLNESHVIDLVDELDAGNIANDDPRLEQLANLAPETFTERIIRYLLPEILRDNLPYSAHAAKALLRVNLEPPEILSVALLFIDESEVPPLAIETIIRHANIISGDDLKRVLHPLVFMALGPARTDFLALREGHRRNPEPIRSLYEKRQEDIITEIQHQIDAPVPESVEIAIKLILAIDDSSLYEKNIRPIIAKLMRRRLLFPSCRDDSSLVDYLREASVKCLELFPDEADNVIQLFLEDRNTTGRKEANKAYGSTMTYNYKEPVAIRNIHRIAFKRLLWAAVEYPTDLMSEAAAFWNHTKEEFAELASGYFNDLIGAAATLTAKYEELDREPTIEIQKDFFSDLDKDNQRTAVLKLQASLLEWAAIGAKHKGIEGVEEFLELYRKLPDEQIIMRASMITHASKLLAGVDSLSLILPDWYRALMDTNTFIRCKAVEAWENVPFELVQNFPDLFFEAFSVTLTDPYLVVHQAAVRSIRRRAFPEEKRSLINRPLQDLIVYYARREAENDFVVDCIDVYTSLCISTEERKGKVDAALIELMQNIEGNALYKLVQRLPFRFRNAPGFTRIVLKAIKDDFTRSININDCLIAILGAPKAELQSCTTELIEAFDGLAPFRPEDNKEALLYVVALTRADNYTEANACLEKLYDCIPKDNRSELWRIKTGMISAASKIEESIYRNQPIDNLHDKWIALQADLEKEWTNE